MRNKALIVGSVVYDDIFDIKGKMKNEISIKDGKLEAINMMFTARNKVRRFGGTSGNIAYGLALQGESPLLFSWVGEDFSPLYENHCKELGIENRVYNAGKETFSAAWYGISDEEKEQIGIFQPNAYGDFVGKIKLEETLSEEDFKSIKVANFSAGTGPSTLSHLKEIREKLGDKVITILHPGQELSVSFNEKIIEECLKLSDIVIGNEVEMEQFRTLYKRSPQEMLEEQPSTIVETIGKKGVIVYQKDKEIKIDPIKPKRVIETTGAGDAFNSGFIKGLLHDWSIEKCAKNGAKMGSLSVEELGGQGYSLVDNK